MWLVFLFNLNGTNYTPKAHVSPPRLKGGSLIHSLSTPLSLCILAGRCLVRTRLQGCRNAYLSAESGKVKGVFATRSPHRPNPIGLTLCCLERVEGHRLTLSGVDLVDGTPILDIKPYIPSYDMPLGGALSGASTDSADVAPISAELAILRGIRVPTWSQPCKDTTLEVYLLRGARQGAGRVAMEAVLAQEQSRINATSQCVGGGDACTRTHTH